MKVRLFKFPEYVDTDFLISIQITWLQYTYVFNLHLHGFSLMQQKMFCTYTDYKTESSCRLQMAEKGRSKMFEAQKKTFYIIFSGMSHHSKMKIGRVIITHYIFYFFIAAETSIITYYFFITFRCCSIIFFAKVSQREN